MFVRGIISLSRVIILLDVLATKEVSYTLVGVSIKTGML